MSWSGSDPSFHLCLILSRSVLPDDRLERARGLIAEGRVDWRRFLNLVVAHQVYPLVARQVTEWGLPVPREVRGELRAMRMLNDARARRLEENLAWMGSLLREKGIPFYPFKGPALARRLYGDVTLRHADDLDLLVREPDFPVVTKFLEGKGFRLAERSRYSASYAGEAESRAVLVDVHYRLMPPYLDVDDSRLVDGLISLEAGHPDLVSLEFLALALHLGRHREFLLKWLVDLDTFLAGTGNGGSGGRIEPGALPALASVYRARRFVEAVLAARETLFGELEQAGVERLRWQWYVPLVTDEKGAWRPYVGKFLLIQSRWRMLAWLLRYPLLSPPDRDGGGPWGNIAYRFGRERRRFRRSASNRKFLLFQGRSREAVPR